MENLNFQILRFRQFANPQLATPPSFFKILISGRFQAGIPVGVYFPKKKQKRKQLADARQEK